MKYQCKRCGSKFATEERAVAHINKRHPASVLFTERAIWANGDLVLWQDKGNTDDGQYVLVCERHSTCLNFTNKSLAMNWVRASVDEFCTVSCDTVDF